MGYGGAGACAALEASALGARVTILEAASDGGGTTALSGGQIYLGGGTPIQQACGFSDTREDMEAYIRIAEVSISTIAPNRIGLSMSPHDVPLSDVEQRIITIRPLLANVSAKVETDIISIITKSETELKAL